MLDVLQIPVLNDNYIYVLHDADSGHTAAVDPALAQPVLDVLQQKNWQLTHILNTHQHSDHVGGNLQLKAKTNCKIYASAFDQQRIPGIDYTLQEGDTVSLGKHQASVLETPGHTSGHIVYHFINDNALFCGDTLFVMGCGRLFEGSPEQMWQSLQKLKHLPPQTRVYCAHEYTQNNANFALSLQPDNALLQQKMEHINEMRAQGKPTVPSTIEQELVYNPFLRSEQADLQSSLNMQGKPAVQVFAKTRQLKDQF